MILSPESSRHVAQHHTGARQSADFLRAHIRDIELSLDATDAQRVVACTVPGYVDPPSRVAAAEAERANGALHAGPMTVQAVRDFEAGLFTAPAMNGLTNHQIHAAKHHAVRHRKALDLAETHLSTLPTK